MIELLYIDLFCGAGGTSTGVAKARLHGRKCAKVIACVNHDANAIASHQANHPDTLHFTEDIRTLELGPLVKHLEKMKKKYPGARTALWASLECTNFSKAKGGQPRDAATLYLGKEYCTPILDQINEIIDCCTWKWTKKKNINGYRVTGPNGNSIFLPAAGYCYYSSGALRNVGSYGCYWSATPGSASNGHSLDFGSSGWVWGDNNRANGFSIRAVLSSPKSLQVL